MTLPVISVNSAPEPDMAKRSPRIWCLNWKVSQKCYKTGQVNLFPWVEVQNTTFLWPTKLPYSFPKRKDALNLKITTFKRNTFKGSVVCSRWMLLRCRVWEQRISVILLDSEKLEEKKTCYSCCMAHKWTLIHILKCYSLHCVFSYGFMHRFHLSMKIMRVEFLGKKWGGTSAWIHRIPRQSLWRSVLEIRESLPIKKPAGFLKFVLYQNASMIRAELT